MVATTGNLILEVTLLGPLSLGHLDGVAISIRSSDYRNRVSQLAGGQPPEKIAAHTWGPYRFVPRLDGIDEFGQHAEPVPMQVGRGSMYALEKTRKPDWDQGNNEQWWSQWDGRPLRVVFHCRREGMAPWDVPYDVPRPE
ncbi:hypothetical protein ACIQXD_05000 [Streptomyces uncialis]|uniref:hypothetical protein n=1 Tax=Streptomyces uncialis TaxID=1048205 RepID=UPI0037FA1267